MSIVVRVEDLWKQYPLRRESLGFKEFLFHLPQRLRGNSNDHFWALKEIDLSVEEGECIGLIGRNGGGKSTLLSLVLGTILPTKGRVTVLKKATPLLELGAGFHPYLTGRENIFVNGVLMGLTKDRVSERMDSIVDFAEIGDFIDAAVRTYSTGMYLRLAFSVAIHTDPELLLIDEILSVGDEAFQKKSRSALLRLMNGGITSLIISHNMNVIKEMCNRVVWIDRGEIRRQGQTGQVVDEYLSWTMTQ